MVPQLSKKIWMSKSIWLIFFSNTTTVDNYFKSVNLPFDCAVLASMVNEETLGESLTEVHRLDKSSDMRSSIFAYWDEETGLQTTSDSLYWRRNSLEGKILNVLTLDVIIRTLL